MKCSGVLGFVTYSETSPGIYTPAPVEVPFKGELLRRMKGLTQESQSINDSVYTGNSVLLYVNKIIKDDLSVLKYIKLSQTAVRWSVTAVDLSDYPKMILGLGGIYYESH